MTKICIIAFYVGKLPDYFPYFISSCQRNPTIDFLLFTDTVSEVQKKNNIQFIPLTLSDFNRLASEKLNLQINLQGGGKIPEFKPAYGLIFSEYLTDYDFWGWCDIDVIWGNMRNFLTGELLSGYDVISAKKKWATGHFMLFKNTALNKRIFEFSPSFKNIFLSEKYTAFEEDCHRWNNGGFLTIDFLNKNNMPVSITDVIKNLDHENKLKAYFKDMMREYPDPVHHIYKHGSWYDLSDKEEFMYYHLLTVKKIWRFYIPKWKILPDEFLVLPKGIFSAKESKGIRKISWNIRRAFFCLKGIYRSSKKQSPAALAAKTLTELRKM